MGASSGRPYEGTAKGLPERPTFAPSSQDWKKSARALLIKLSSLLAVSPGSRWPRCQALGFRGRLRAPVPPVHPFTPPSPPGVTRGGVVFPPPPEAVLARPGTAGPPRFGEPRKPSPPRPSPSAVGAGGSREAGVCFKSLGLETQPLSLNLSSTSLSPAASVPETPSSRLRHGRTGSSLVRPGARRRRALLSGGSVWPGRPGHPCGGGGRRAE